MKENFGEQNARLYAEANQKAVEEICGLCSEIENSTGLQRRNAFIDAWDGKEAESL